MHWDILDPNRQAILPSLRTFKDRGFYLAGGTGLALQIGHRDSIDFDFFIDTSFETDRLVEDLPALFPEHTVVLTAHEAGTVSCLIDGAIRLSFFEYRYPILKPLTATEHLSIASIEDIACMKLSAITGRSLEKDYVDLYFLLQKLSLRELLGMCIEKYPSLDQNLILKSLVYFDDVLHEPILFKEGHAVFFDMVKEYLSDTVTKHVRGG
jgi:hypothetical protein